MNLSKTNTQGKDINWINALKALCILFVFLRHSENYYGQDLGWFDGLYQPFYVNAFFFVSGYLLFWKQLSTPKIEETSKKYLTGGGRLLFSNVLFRIIIPSIIFAVIEFFPKKLIKGDGLNATDLLIETLGGCTYWFTSALVVAELMFLILLLTRRRNIWFYSIIAFVLSTFGWYLIKTNFSIIGGYPSFPWQYKIGFICMCYLALGGLYWKYEASINKLMKGWMVLLLAIVYIVGSIVFRPYLSAGYMTSMEMIHPVGVLWSLLASILLVELCKILPKIKILTFIGQNSIGFYFMSGALPIVFSMIVHKEIPGTHVWAVLPIFLCCVIVGYYVMKLLTRWAPWLFDLRLINK